MEGLTLALRNSSERGSVIIPVILDRDSWAFLGICLQLSSQKGRSSVGGGHV